MISMAACTMQVDNESHCVKINDRRCRGSLELRSREGIFKSNVVNILRIFSEFL